MKALGEIFRWLETKDTPFDNQMTMGLLEDGFRHSYEQRDSYEFLLSLLGTLTEDSIFKTSFRKLVEVRYIETTVCSSGLKLHNQICDRDCIIMEFHAVEDIESVQTAL